MQATVLGSYRGEELFKRVAVLNFTGEKLANGVLGGGQRAVVFLSLATELGHLPTGLRHRFFFQSATADSVKLEQVLDDGGIIIPRTSPLAVGSPVRGRWIAANGLSNDTGHRRAIITEGGTPAFRNGLRPTGLNSGMTAWWPAMAI